MKTITIEDHTWQRLLHMKAQYKLRTLDEAIRLLEKQARGKERGKG